MSTLDPRRDPLDEALAQAPYLDDQGFTDGVLDRLPPARRSVRTPILVGFGLGSAVLGLALVLGPAAELPLAIARFSAGTASFGAVVALVAIAAAALFASVEER